jgi:hypothetical protein
VLLSNELVNALKVILDLGSVSVLGELTALGHLANVVLKLSDAGSWDLRVVQISLVVDVKMRRCGHTNILEYGGFRHDILTVLNELLAKFFREFVRLSTLGRAMVHMILHEIEKKGV